MRTSQGSGAPQVESTVPMTSGRPSPQALAHKDFGRVELTVVKSLRTREEH